MRILFLHRDLPPDSYTGVAIQVHRLAQALSARGHEVAVLTRSALPPGARYRVLPADGPLLRLALRLLPGLKRLWYPLWYRCAPKDGYDVVHVHGDGGLLRYRPGYVRTFYGTAGMEQRHSRTLKGKLAQGLSFWMERRESRRCAACVGISPHIAGYLPGVDKVIPCLLPDAPDAPDAPGGPDMRNNPGKARAGKTPHPSLLYLGSRNSRKRGELALDLYRRLRPAFPGLRLTYVGPRADAEALEGSPGLEGVAFRSRVDQDELDRLYRESWAYLCLSSYEGFGVGIIEAMARGCPVLTTPHPGSDFLVRDGEDAVVAAPEAAADALAALLADGPRREALAARALERSRRFAPDAVADAYLALYDKVRATVRDAARGAGSGVRKTAPDRARPRASREAA